VFPPQFSHRPWSGDFGSHPRRGVDTEGGEDLLLELRRPVNELDAPTGVQLVKTDGAYIARY
jgi:hypothetical protein